MFDDATKSAIGEIARRMKLEPEALLAVAEVESGGKAFATVDGRKEPLIRFEGHYFDKRVPAAKRAMARAAGLADPKAGAVKNPSGQAARWALLARAEAIDAKAARESASWGLGQVMGAHWEWLGYSSVDALVAEARSGVAGQVELMARYIDKAGLADALRRSDWAEFAKGYNGPGYKKGGYDRKIAAAYARYVGKQVGTQPKDSVLKRGSKGPFVTELQTNLVTLGYRVDVDGKYGEKTETAVKAFQKAKGLEADGWAGPRTIEAIGKALSEKETAPKIEAAKETVPNTADKAVEKEVSWWRKIVLWATGSGIVGSGAAGKVLEADWTTIAAVVAGIVVVGALGVIGFVLLGRRVVATFEDINQRVKQ